MIRNAYKVAILAMLSIVLGGGISTADEKTKVSLTLNWIPYGLHVGAAVAKTEGLYDKANLDVEILRGYGSTESVKRVALGTTTFALADATPVIYGRAKGLAVKMVATILDKSGNAIYYHKSAGINSPKDLEGKTIATSAGASYQKLFPAFAKITGVDESKVEWVIMNAPSIIPSFAANKVNAMASFTTEQPNIVSAASKAGFEWGRILYADHGLDLYSVGLIASDAMIITNPELVKKFVNATMEGYRLAVEDPRAAADAFHKLFPESDADLTLAQWKASMELFVTDTAKKHGLGYMTEEKMNKTLDLVRSFAKVGDELTGKDLYTMEFLEPHMVSK